MVVPYGKGRDIRVCLLIKNIDQLDECLDVRIEASQMLQKWCNIETETGSVKCAIVGDSTGIDCGLPELDVRTKQTILDGHLSS